MNRFRAWVLLAGALCALFPAMAGAQEARPNIVFFLIDDQRNDTLGCAGHPFVQTPEIDRLATEGVRFTNAFVTTSICAASRATFFTGLYERTHGFTFGKPPVRPEHLAQGYPVLLREAGYRTGFVGKFGVSVEKGSQDLMFDAHRQIPPGTYFIDMPDGAQRHETELAADWAIDFLDETESDTPFCLSISFNSVHAKDNDKSHHYPYPPDLESLYADIPMPRPRLDDPAIFESQPEFLKTSLNRVRYFWRWDTPEKYDKNLRDYFRLLTSVDRSIGRVRAALEERGLAKNTVIIVMADNGYYMGDRGFAGKWSHYEQSLRVPLIINDPRANSGGLEKRAMVLNVDVPPTILELAGVPIPKHYQGRSLIPALTGDVSEDWREDFFCEHLMDHPEIPKWEGVRTGRYVYARYFEQEPPFEFLHDLEEDPDQLKNLAADPQHADLLEKLRARCVALRDEYTADREESLKALQ